MGAGALLKAFAKGAAGGCLAYFAADTASDVYTFFAVRRAALERVAASADVAGLVGAPWAPGPWYNGTLGFSHRDRVAHVTFAVAGAARSTDVSTRAARRPGPRSNILYNAFGAGVWDLVTCQAMFPGEGGLATPRNLMEPLPAVAAKETAEAAATGAAECLPCQQQQQQQQQQQRWQRGGGAGGDAAGDQGKQQQRDGGGSGGSASGWGHWLWWGSRRSNSARSRASSSDGGGDAGSSASSSSGAGR
jgi:hypothetical protein